MECKKCGKEFEGELELCPECAEEAVLPEEEMTEMVEETAEETVEEMTEMVEETAEETVEEITEETAEDKDEPKPLPAEPVSPWKIVAATAVCMLLLMVLAVTVINSITGRNWPFDLAAGQTEAAQPTVGTTAPSKIYTAEELGMVDGITTKEVYAAAAEALTSADEVVVTIGQLQLTNAQLQVLYWNQFYRFVNNYDYSATGFDPSAPHGEQTFPQSEVTWEQYFLSGALQTWQQYAALNIAAKEDGFQLTEDMQKELDNLPQAYDEQAKENGFTDASQLLLAQMGPAVTMEDLVAVETMFAIGDSYYVQYRDSLSFTREEVKAHFEKNKDIFANNYGVSEETGKLVSVRHVLIQPEGCELDDNGYVVATDEQWEACRVKGQELLDAWAKAGATEENFALLAAQNSVDTGSSSNGGLYENVQQGQMVQAFDAWIFDEARETGNYGLVKTEFGYHLMYYVSGEDAWYLYGLSSSDGLLSMTCYEKITEYSDANPMEVAFDKIVFGMADFSIAEEVAGATEPTEATADTTAATE